MKNTKKTANKLPVPGKVRKGFRFYCAAVLSVALVLGCSVTAFAANDPIAVVNPMFTQVTTRKSLFQSVTQHFVTVGLIMR